MLKDKHRVGWDVGRRGLFLQSWSGDKKKKAKNVQCLFTDNIQYFGVSLSRGLHTQIPKHITYLSDVLLNRKPTSIQFQRLHFCSITEAYISLETLSRPEKQKPSVFLFYRITERQRET